MEDTAQSVRDINVPAAEADWLAYHELCLRIGEVGARLIGNMAAIKNSDENMKAHDRPDLVINHNALRERIEVELMGGASEDGKPVRYGLGGDPEFKRGRALFYSTTATEQKEHQLWRERNPQWAGVRFSEHETDNAYRQRLMNWNAQTAAAARRDDPIRVASLKAKEIVEALLRPEGSYEAARGPRRIQVTNFVVHATGQAVRHESPADGNNGPGTYAPPKAVPMR